MPRCVSFDLALVFFFAAMLWTGDAFAHKNVGAGSSSIPCNSYYEASIAYNYSSKTVEFCNGSSWGNLLASGMTGGIYLGTSVSVTNPSVSGDLTTGLYSAAQSTVSVAAGGTGIVTIGTNGMNIANGTLTGTSQTSNFLNVTGTLNSVNTVTARGVDFEITSAGSSAFTQNELKVGFLPGYTGSSTTQGLSVSNAVAGTKATGWTGGGNIGGIISASGTTAGNNLGISTFAQGSSSFNLGMLSEAVSNSNSPALNVGVGGFALSATTNVAGFFGLTSAAPTLSGSAALIADNGTTTSPIFVAQVNGAAAVTIGSTGNVGIGTTAPVATLEVNGNVQIDTTTAQLGSTVVGGITTTPSVIPSTITYIKNTGLTGTLNAWNAVNPQITDPATGSYYGYLSAPSVVTTSTIAHSIYGGIFEPRLNAQGASSGNYLYGIIANADRGEATSTAEFSSIYGGEFNPIMGTSLPIGAVTISVVGVRTEPQIYSGTVGGNVISLYASPSFGSASGPANLVIPSYYGLYLEVPTYANGATITNNYGVFQVDPAAYNYFGGKVGIGSTSPVASLDINGYGKLKINASAPATCDATHEGSIAYTGTTTHYLCFCDGTSWKQAHSPATACTW